jgi:hypothetical protein
MVHMSCGEQLSALRVKLGYVHGTIPRGVQPKSHLGATFRKIFVTDRVPRRRTCAPGLGQPG